MSTYLVVSYQGLMKHQISPTWTYLDLKQAERFFPLRQSFGRFLDLLRPLVLLHQNDELLEGEHPLHRRVGHQHQPLQVLLGPTGVSGTVIEATDTIAMHRWDDGVAQRWGSRSPTYSPGFDFCI